MIMSSTADGSSTALKATYDSPSGHQEFSHTLPTPHIDNDGAVNPRAKTKYLSELRASTKKLQEDINKFLTEKMEEDKKAAVQNDLNSASKQKSKDEQEEENYGEENAEEET